MRITDWDDAYANAPHISGGADYPARWEEQAARFRAEVPPRHLPYGPHARQLVDLFLPGGAAPRGLAVFVHGGYWRAFDRTTWSHLAAGPLARGWAVALPGYVLAPEVRVTQITAMIARAVETVAAAVAGPIRLAGHSAGGHLVARQVCTDTALAPDTVARIERVVSISGVHDLRPLTRTAINADLRIDGEEGRAESPALLEPLPGTRLHAWVGADERPEFVRQSALLTNVWTGLAADTALTVEPGRHHFDVIEGLAEADHPLTDALCGA